METVKSVRQSMKHNDWAVSIDLTDAYLHVPIHPQSRKYLRFIYEDQVFHFTALPFEMSLSQLIFSKLMDVIAAFLRQHALTVFPYLDDWLTKDLIRNRLISQTKFCIQTIQSLGFLINRKKSELLPSQKFTFIGMEFQTQQNLVRVPMDRVESLVLTIKSILSCKNVSAQTFFSLLGKQCNSRFCSPRQTSLMSPANVSSVCLETSYSSSQSSDSDHRYDSISLTMVDDHKLLRNRNSYPPSGSQNIPLHGCQSFWIGSSFRASETILSSSLDGRPIPAPYQHVRNDGHTISTETSHNIYSPFLHHDIYR